jgi:hypothetical protein
MNRQSRNTPCTETQGIERKTQLVQKGMRQVRRAGASRRTVQRPKLNKKNEAGDQHRLRAKRTQVHGVTSRLQISDENLVCRSTLGFRREQELDPKSGVRRKNNTEQGKLSSRSVEAERLKLGRQDSSSCAKMENRAEPRPGKRITRAENRPRVQVSARDVENCRAENQNHPDLETSQREKRVTDTSLLEEKYC